MKTSVKIVLRKSRKSKSLGHLHVRTITNRVAQFRSLGITVPVKHWDSKTQQVLPSFKGEYKDINNRISEVLTELKENYNSINSLDVDTTAILPYWKAHIKNTKKASTENIRNTTYNHFSRFLSEKGLKDLTFPQLTPREVDMFNKYLSEKGLTPETCKCYMGFLKAIANKAKSEGIQLYKVNPFTNAKFKPFRNKKPKTVDREFLRELQDCKLRPKQAKARDMFLFQLMCGGLRVGDLLMLRWSDLLFTDKGIYLNYRQEKSRKEMMAKVPMAAMKYLHHMLVENAPNEVKKLESEQNRLVGLMRSLRRAQEKLYSAQVVEESMQDEDIIDFDEKDYLEPPVGKQATVAYLNVAVKNLNQSILSTYKDLVGRQQQNPQKTIFGFLNEAKIHRSGTVTKESLGNIINGTLKYNYHLSRICKTLGRPKITTHQARHTYAQFLADNNINVHHISQGLGHSSIQITANYLREMNTSTLDVMNDRLGDIFT